MAGRADTVHSWQATPRSLVFATVADSSKCSVGGVLDRAWTPHELLSWTKSPAASPSLEDLNMHDNVEPRGRSSVGWTLLGFVLGATAGAGVALLMAPTSGERARARIGATARGWRESAVGTLADARSRDGNRRFMR